MLTIVCLNFYQSLFISLVRYDVVLIPYEAFKLKISFFMGFITHLRDILPDYIFY